jgi:hypothetical protein
LTLNTVYAKVTSENNENKKTSLTDMSHSPESQETHQERPEPERIPFEGDPGDDLYRTRKVGNAVDGYSWITTHQGPNGDFYTIRNASTPEANMTIYNEDKRN